MRKWWYVALSFLMLAPVYWQPRVQAGDLSSHIYNAWLAQLIEAGRTQGLVIVSQTTNILFDLMLGGLFRLFGAEGEWLSRARNAGLNLSGRLPVLKNLLMRHAMG